MSNDLPVFVPPEHKLVAVEEIQPEPVPMMGMCGGVGAPYEPSQEEKDVALAHKADLEKETGETYEAFNVVNMTSQTVAGFNYRFLVELDGGKKAVFSVFKP